MGKTPPTSSLDMTLKKSDGKVPVILAIKRMQGTPSLPSLPGPLPVVVAPDRGGIYGWSKTKLSTYAKLNCLK